MLDRNVGFKNRFRRFIDFEDWEAQDAIVFFSKKEEAEFFRTESETVVYVSYFGYFFLLQHSADILIFNNVKADIMKEEGGIKYIFAVDVARGSRTQFYEYGCAISGW
ncbi:hypothetical protein PsorP6_005437 [Peronosclerospora sorghi]|uniref:Uncharacterized protein n=1 Tax=Peronosclerospora sorghi TaxID=230839 RepID=A0ACC0W376_9STRA|nr:hypothetical protein PsorP6_005437 [Peronosclerospora sorghi]